MLEKALKLIIEQQGEDVETNLYGIGEQLKDICKENPQNAELVAKDLEVKEMSLESLGKSFDKYAKARAKNGQSCISLLVADRLIREFYSLGQRQETSAPIEPQSSPSDSIFDLQNLFD